MGEIRKDYFSSRVVIVSEARAKRPSDTAKKGKRGSCSFCPGREAQTPPAELVLIERKDAISIMKDEVEPIRGWSVRVFPNMFSAVSPIKTPLMQSDFEVEPAFGYQYVAVATPNHNQRFHQMQVKQWHRILTALQEMTKRLLHREGVQFVYSFINYGEAAGASLSHPHVQVITFPSTPPLILEEVRSMDGLTSNTCKLCSVLQKESQGPRTILRGEQYVAFAPWAPTHAYEFWIAPLHHQTTILECTSKHLEKLGEMLKASLTGMARVLHDPPFNLAFHVSPRNHTDGKLHWHIEVYPQTTKWAGVERGARVYINQVSPERAAKKLSSAIRQ